MGHWEVRDERTDSGIWVSDEGERVVARGCHLGVEFLTSDSRPGPSLLDPEPGILNVAPWGLVWVSVMRPGEEARIPFAEIAWAARDRTGRRFWKRQLVRMLMRAVPKDLLLVEDSAKAKWVFMFDVDHPLNEELFRAVRPKVHKWEDRETPQSPRDV